MRVLAKFAIAAGLLTAASAQGAVVSLNFEGIAPYPHSNNTIFIQNYYNGGTASNGNSGTNFGVSFGGNALLICLNDTSTFCSNTSRGGLAPASARGGLFFLSGSETFLNFAAGFTTGFSFNYASSVTGAVQVYDGLNGTGNLLSTVFLTPNISGCGPYGAGFCPFGPAGVSFTGTAKSISFGGVANQIVFDDITFGSNVPGPVNDVVPEPSTWMMLIAGFGLVGASMRRRNAVRTA
jgi:hypothetical protein